MGDVKQTKTAVTAHDVGEGRMNSIRGLCGSKNRRRLANQILVEVDGRVLSHEVMICRPKRRVYAELYGAVCSLWSLRSSAGAG